jgi:hypothetical protein
MTGPRRARPMSAIAAWAWLALVAFAMGAMVGAVAARSFR